jgi:hypothetical protein
MKSFRLAGAAVLSLFVGGALGAYLSRPPKVKAQGVYSYSINVQKVKEGSNAKATVSHQIIGFACTAEDCYIATE